MKRKASNLFHINSLRTYITISVLGIIAIALIISTISFYMQTSKTLQTNYKEQMAQQLNTTVEKVNEQVGLIDYIYSLYMSNTLIYDSVESVHDERDHVSAVEKQMTYLLINNYLWKEQFVNSVYIFTASGNTFQVSSFYSHLTEERNRMLYEQMDYTEPALTMQILDGDDNSLYFIRNIFSYNTGKYIATMIISIDREIWMNYLSRNIDKNWFIYFYNNKYPYISTHSVSEKVKNIAGHYPAFRQNSFLEFSLAQDDFLAISEKLDNLELYSVVVAPKDQIRENLASALRSYLMIIIMIAIVTVIITFMLSRAITTPVTKMILHVNRVASGHYEEHMPNTQLYDEFQAFTDAFNHMLQEINTYHADNLEKQLLLKNAEIQALQSQINPHFLFNTLNTLAWKAQMADNAELYQMTISLGELLKSNVLSKELTYITIDDELRYIKFYVYLQKMRFEDKISVEFAIDETLGNIQIPCFSIQTLVENAFVHGLEKKRGNGFLNIFIGKENLSVKICVTDNGKGFDSITYIEDIIASKTDSHTHVGLKNLDRRLFLLYGESARLHIESEPDIRTSVSFFIPVEEDCL